MSPTDAEAFKYFVGAVAMACLVVIVVAGLIYDYRLKSRRITASATDNGATKDLWETARRMETRIGYLEQVLDTEVPGWRNRSVQ